MIRNLSNFYWEVSVGHRVQKVVGTLFDARKMEQELFARRSSNIDEARAKQRDARARIQPELGHRA